MKKKSYGTVLISILFVGAVVGWMTLNSNQESQPAVEYRAVCRNLPANAHWTSNGETRKEIPQTESSPNVREPSPVGTYDASTDNDKCNFVCDEGYKREDVTCRVTVGVFHNITKGTIIVTDDTTTYTIMDKNLGASVAGTGKDSYGSYFQRGNNYGFASTGTISHSSGLVPNALAYGPSPLSYYSGSTFIRSVTSSNHSDYWTGGQNDNLRGGSGDIEANGRDRDNARTKRQGPCPSGYHVPSAGEWSALVTIRWNAIGSGGDSLSVISGLSYLSTSKATQFMDDFLLPRAGLRSFDSSASTQSQGNVGYYWSSTPSPTYWAFNLVIANTNVHPKGHHPRAYGFSLRCFKDS